MKTEKQVRRRLNGLKKRRYENYKRALKWVLNDTPKPKKVEK